MLDATGGCPVTSGSINRRRQNDGGPRVEGDALARRFTLGVSETRRPCVGRLFVGHTAAISRGAARQHGRQVRDPAATSHGHDRGGAADIDAPLPVAISFAIAEIGSEVHDRVAAGRRAAHGVDVEEGAAGDRQFPVEAERCRRIRRRRVGAPPGDDFMAVGQQPGDDGAPHVSGGPSDEDTGFAPRCDLRQTLRPMMTSHALIRRVRARGFDPHPHGPGFDDLGDIVVEIDDAGRISRVAPATGGVDVDVGDSLDLGGCVLLPGFVDAHVHYPQTRVIGSASGPLLEWLERSIFPEESRFVDPAYAAAVAREFCDALVARGTTCAVVYGSSIPRANELLFAELERRGLRAFVGLTLMDRGAPRPLLCDTSAALDACVGFVDEWHGRDGGRLQFAITPRFALSCTSALMRGAADLAARHGLVVQTHIAETHAEIGATAIAFPDCEHYLDVYADHGLCTSRTLFGHCIWLADAEWDRLAATDAVVVHCPDSNFFLGSGRMPMNAASDRGIRVALGSDVGAGRSFDMARIAASAYDTALASNVESSATDVLWLATRGGARAVGAGDKLGRLAPGYDADLVAIPLPDYLVGAPPSAVLDAVAFRHDRGPVAATIVRGLRLDAGESTSQ